MISLKRFLSCSIALCSLAAMPFTEPAIAETRVVPAWQSLGDGPSNSAQVASTVDSAGALHIVTVRDTGATGFAYDYRTISAAGLVSGAQTILSGWLSLSYPSLLSRSDGSLSLLFFGNRTGDTSDPYSGPSLFRLTSDATRSTWTLDGAVYDGVPGLGAQSANSGVLYNGNQEIGVSIQGGTVRAFNTTSLLAVQTTDKPCCAYGANAAVATSSGSVVAGYYSNATDQAGVFFQALFPSLGVLWQAPGAELDTRVRVPLANRQGSLYTAYAYGSNADGVRVWKVGADPAAYRDIPRTKGAIGATVTSDGNHLWAIWGVADGSTYTYVARSNARATRFGTPIRVSSTRGATAVYYRSAEAGRGHLDLFITSNGSAAGISSQYARIGIPLEIQARPGRVGRLGGVVVFTVTDGDLPVRNATVRSGRIVARTDGRGHARLRLGTGAAALAVTASKAGYTQGSTTVRRS